ncbi:MAG: DegT/DnrJ/EryC1/StrS family aminotransferase [Nitrospiraceae bacterium]
MKIQRHLAPTAAPLGMLDLLRGAFGLLGQVHGQDLEENIARHLGASNAWLVSSGKAALATILRALKRQSSRTTVVIPAYTCFSVPSAVLKAGLNVALCDVKPETLDYEIDQLDSRVTSDTLAIVVPHLLGKPADIFRIQAVADAKGAIVIEDAAQALGGKEGKRLLGTQTHVGFFSLGRGKNVSAGSGGIIVTNNDVVGSAVRQVYTELAQESLSSAVATFVSMLATTVMIHPSVYWLPAGLPFLGLGETVFYQDFPLQRLHSMKIALLTSWKTRLERSNMIRADIAQRWIRALALPIVATGSGQQIPWLRLPVLTSTPEDKRSVCRSAQEQGFGISSLYPAPISDIPELRSQFVRQNFPGARTLAERLVTLPTHEYVCERDIERVASVLNSLHLKRPLTILGAGALSMTRLIEPTVKKSVSSRS